MRCVKPFLRWAGSKRQQLSHLSKYWNPDYERYVEPFAGSACLFFHIGPRTALLSDKNADLIETLDAVRKSPERIYDAVTSIPRTQRRYYSERSVSPTSLSKFDKAVRFIYLNRNCFNGIYRTNRKGQFNVPFADSRAGAFVTREEFLTAASLLKGASLRACDFGSTLKSTREGDFVYLDPPYVVNSRRVFRQYDARPFDAKDLQRLGWHLDRLDERQVDFLVSFADCKESRELAKPWIWRRLRVRRNVAGFAGARKEVYELLITNIELL